MNMPVDNPLIASANLPVLVKNHPFRAPLLRDVVLAGCTLDEIVKRCQFREEYLQLVRVWVDDTEIPREWWKFYRPRPGHEIYIAITPQMGGDGGGSDPLQIVATVAIIALSVAFGPEVGAMLLPAGTSAAVATAVGGAVISFAGALLLGALIPPPKPASLGSFDAPQVDPSYQLTGTQNRSGAYQVIPRVFGKRRVYPLQAARPYSEFSGNDQYLRMLFVVGYGPLQITNIKIGETPIEAFPNVEVEVHEGGPAGWAGNAAITLYTQTIQETALTIELTNPNAYPTPGDWSVRNTEPDTEEIVVDITMPQGIAYMDNNGNPTSAIAQHEVEYRKVGDVTWLVPDWITPLIGEPGYTARLATDGHIDFSDATLSALRQGARFKPAGAPGTFEVRVRRNTPNFTGRFIGKSFWTALRSIAYESPVSRTDVCLIAVRMKATNVLNGVPDSINCIAESFLPVWDGAQWAWQISRNPAWAYSHILRRRGDKVIMADSRLDLVAIKDFADACDANDPTDSEPYWYFDGVIEGGSIISAAKTILAHGRATFTIRDGKYSVVRDVEQVTPVQHITPRNSWNYSGTKTFVDPPHALKIRFVNEDAGYQDDERIVYDDGYDENNATKFEMLEFFGATRSSQVWREGRYHIAVGRLRPEQHRVMMDIEAIRCTLGDLVQFSHDVISVGLGYGRIKSVIDDTVNVTGLVLDSAVPMQPATTYGLRIRNADGDSQLVTLSVVGVAGNYTSVSVSSVIPVASAPASGDLFMFGLLNSESMPAIVRKIEPRADLSAMLTLVPAQAGVWTADSGTIPAFNSYITEQTPIEQTKPAVPSFTLRADESAIARLQDGTLQDRIAVLIDPPASTGSFTFKRLFQSIRMLPAGYEAQARLDDGAEYILRDTTTRGELEAFLAPARQGYTYYVRVRAINENGVTSDWSAEQSILVTGKTTPPSDVANPAYLHIETGTQITWDAVTDLDFDHYEVRYGAVWATATKVYEGIDNFFLSEYLAAGSHTFLIKAFDVLGLESVNAVSLNVTVQNPPNISWSIGVSGENYLISITAGVTSYPVKFYDIRRGGSFEGGTQLSAHDATSFAAKVDWLGSQVFWVAAVDHAGNMGNPTGNTLNITAPNAPTAAQAIDGENAIISWTPGSALLPIAKYIVRHSAAGGGGTLQANTQGDRTTVRVDWNGSRTFYVSAVDSAGNEGAQGSVAVVINQPNALNVSQQIIALKAELAWDAPVGGTLPTKQYEIRYGASWAAGTFVAITTSRNIRIPIDWLGSRTFWVAHVDSAGTYNTAASAAVNVVAPAAPVVSVERSETEYVLSWTIPAASLPIDEYEIRHGATYGASTLIGTVKGTTFRAVVNWGGSRTFWVAARDQNSNLGATTGNASLSIELPLQPSVSAEVIDNNVLLRWSDAQVGLPIASYEVYKGATFATATLIGTAGGRFSAVFENAAGTYVYWIRAKDVAGNYGSEGSVTATVGTPPDYVLYNEFNSQLDAEKGFNTLRVTGQRYALALNGSTQWATVNVAASGPLDIDANPVTIEAWIYLNAIGTAHGIVDRGTGGVEGYGIYVTSAGKLNLGSHGGSNFDSLTTLQAKRWYHVIGITNGASSSIWIDGVQDQTGTVSVVASSVATLFLGKFDSYGYKLQGQLGPVRIYNRAIDATEALEHYRGIYRNDTGLVGAWDFDEGSGDTSVDDSDYANDATLIASPTWTPTVLDGRFDPFEPASSLFAAVNPHYSFEDHFRMTGNLLIYSEAMAGTGWNDGNTARTANSRADPFGTSVAAKYDETAVNAEHKVYADAVTIESNAPYAAACYFYPGERTKGDIVFMSASWTHGAYATFDLTAKTISAATVIGSGTALKSEIVSVGNGWYRAAVSGKLNGGITTGYMGIRLRDANGNLSYLGVASNGFHVIGGQLVRSNDRGDIPGYYKSTASAKSFASLQALVNDGYTHGLAPTMQNGRYSEVIDWGVTVPSSKVTITLNRQILVGGLLVTPTISYKLNIGDSWTDIPSVWSAFIVNFRYVKITLDIAALDPSRLEQWLTANYKLDVKLLNDAGMASCNSGDSGGTTVSFNVSFVDVNSITVTPMGTSAVIGVVDFTDVQFPADFKILLFDRATGNRVSGTASWSAKGV